MRRPEIEALARSVLAHGMVQLVTRFPQSVDQLQLPTEEVLAKAIALAEQAVSLNPESADAFCAIGRIMLVHGGESSTEDALEMFEHALSLVPNHDAAQMGIATVYRIQGRHQQALELVNLIIKKGSGLAQPFVLRAMLAVDAADFAGALRDLERATLMAPDDGLIHLDAARAASLAGDPKAAENFQERAARLLGPLASQLDNEIAKSKF